MKNEIMQLNDIALINIKECDDLIKELENNMEADDFDEKLNIIKNKLKRANYILDTLIGGGSNEYR